MQKVINLQNFLDNNNDDYVFDNSEISNIEIKGKDGISVSAKNGSYLRLVVNNISLLQRFKVRVFACFDLEIQSDSMEYYSSIVNGDVSEGTRKPLFYKFYKGQKIKIKVPAVFNSLPGYKLIIVFHSKTPCNFILKKFKLVFEDMLDIDPIFFERKEFLSDKKPIGEFSKVGQPSFLQHFKLLPDFDRKAPLGLILGQPKAASTWLGNCFTFILSSLGYNIAHTSYLDPLDMDLKFLYSEGYDYIFCHNWPKNALIKKVPAVEIYRDLRDWLVSHYYSMIKTHPGEGVNLDFTRTRKEFQKLSFDDALLKILEHEGQWPATVTAFSNPGYANSIPYEIFFQDFKNNIISFLKTLKIYSKHKKDLGIILPLAFEKFSFENMSGGRKKGEEDTSNFYRKGVAGDWKNKLKKEQLDALYKKWGDYQKKLYD